LDRLRGKQTESHVGEGSSGRRWLLLAALLCVAPGALSQTVYRCSNGTSTYLSDRPCVGGPPGKLGSLGPAPAPARRDYAAPSYIPPVGKAPDHLGYLSPQCASLNDAIRTGPARGLGSQAMSDLRHEYRNKCDEDESAARQRLSQDKRAQRDETRARQQAEQAEQQRAATSREQCGELLRILHAKRKQFDAMTPGEKTDFQRFEANYNGRCRAG
jgi:hypothetical protein